MRQAAHLCVTGEKEMPDKEARHDTALLIGERGLDGPDVWCPLVAKRGKICGNLPGNLRWNERAGSHPILQLRNDCVSYRIVDDALNMHVLDDPFSTDLVDLR